MTLRLITLTGQRHTVNEYAAGAADDNTATVLLTRKFITFSGGGKSANDNVRTAALNGAIVSRFIHRSSGRRHTHTDVPFNKRLTVNIDDRAFDVGDVRAGNAYRIICL
jgi:hypothetical protein